MIVIRSVVFNFLFYLNLLVLIIAALPTLLMPRWAIVAVAGFWARTNLWLLRVVCDVKAEFRGLEKIPLGPALVSAKHQSLWETFALLVILLSLFGWMGLSDYVRAEFLRNRQMDYVRAARALGVGNRRIMWRHILPNSMTPVVTLTTLARTSTSRPASFARSAKRAATVVEPSPVAGGGGSSKRTAPICIRCRPAR